MVLSKATEIKNATHIHKPNKIVRENDRIVIVKEWEKKLDLGI